MIGVIRVTIFSLLLALALGLSVSAQQPDAQVKQPDLDGLIAQLRDQVDRDLPVWREVFKAISMGSAYDPELVAGFSLRADKKPAEVQLDVITGLIAFQKINGDSVLDDGIPKLRDFLLKYANCGTAGTCSKLEKEFKDRTIAAKTPAPRLDAFDPEKVFEKCIAEQDPKNPCTRQFCFNTATFGGSFLLMLTLGDGQPGEELTAEQKQLEEQKQRLIDGLNRLARKVGDTPMDKDCKDGLAQPQAAPKNKP